LSSLTPRHPPRPPLFPYTTLFRSQILLGSLPGDLGINLLDVDVADAVRELTDHGDVVARAIGHVPGVQAQRDITRVGVLQIPLRSEEHTSELQSRGHLVCRLLLEK